MSEKDPIKNLIENVSSANIKKLFQKKCDHFHVVEEKIPIKNQDNFEDALQIGVIEFKSPSIKIIVSKIQVTTNLTERSGKKKQYDEAKSHLPPTVDGGIFVFHDEQGNFRFSLIFKEYLGTKTQGSNFKRFTFFVDKSQTNNTFKQQIDSDDFSSFESIKKIFSVEKVNKDFYQQIAEEFYNLTGREFIKNNNPIDKGGGALRYPSDSRIQKQEFAVRLIGRIVFCWFLKLKKTEGGESLIHANILSSGFVKNQSENYYLNILEKLFFEVLNRPQEDRREDIKKNTQFSNIPFLNGGLFEAQVEDYYLKEHRITIPNNWFESFYEILEQYNFTIDENSSKDAEIAIDPEILGRIFENLLAEINPETQASARKSTGSFYTPREIVDYMVDQSLIYYLAGKTDVKTEEIETFFSDLEDDTSQNALDRDQRNSLLQPLNELKIIDPACGSGAFPMGILHRMLWLYDKIYHLNQVESEGKLNTKNEEENIYIEPGAKVIYSPGGYDLQLICTYKGGYDFHLLIIEDGKQDDKGNFKVTLLTKFIKIFLNEYFQKKGTSTIANLFSQGYIEGVEGSETFNTLRGKRALNKIIGEDNHQQFILWEYKTYNTQRKYRYKSKIEEELEAENIEVENENVYLTEKNTDKYFYKLKERIIQNVIHGVDIQPIAVEISKLRFFLSLMVDEKVNSREDNFGIEPLPNLEFKFVCANSLIGLDEKHYTSNSNIPDGDLNELKKLKREYFISYSNKKDKIKNDFENVQKRLKNIFYSKQASRLGEWDPFSHKKSDWFDPEFMFGVDEDFDVVIGNPPYISLEKVKKNKDEYKSFYDTAAGRGDIYCLFYEHGLNISKPETGLLTFITSNKWMRAGYGEALREFFADKNPLQLIDFGGFQVFENATVDTNILIIENTQNQDNLKACHFQDDYQRGDDLRNYFQAKKIQLKNLNQSAWTIANEAEQAIQAKIEKYGTPLKDWDIQINRGVLTGYNQAFIIDQAKKEELIAQDPKSAEVIKPVLRGRDIKRYSHKWSENYILIIKFGSYKTLQNDYPAVYNHLKKYEAKLKARGQCKYSRGGKSVVKTDYPGQHHWLELDNNPKDNYIGLFEKEKIVYPETTLEANFYYSKEPFFVDKTCFIITGDNIKFILVVLSSKAGKFIYTTFCSGTRLGKKGYQYNAHALITFSIPKLSEKEQQPFIDLADQMLKLQQQADEASDSYSKENLERQISYTDKQIDTLVYQLYHLTDEEIRVIEG